jgi:hypothetical protein
MPKYRCEYTITRVVEVEAVDHAEADAKGMLAISKVPGKWGVKIDEIEED